MTKFYKIPAHEFNASIAPKEHVILPRGVIGEDENGEPILDPMIHVNTLEEVEAWEAFRVFPETPHMIYG